MTGLVRKATLFGVCGLFVAGAALANVPSPGNSDVPNVIYAMGTDGSNVAHSLASPVSGTARSFTIVVRDFTNNPIAGSAVTLDFSGCTGFHICDVEPAGEPQQTTNCGPPNTLTGNTNAAGVFSATLIGGGDVSAAADPPGAPNYCVEVIADGVNLGSASLYMANPNGWALDLVDGVDNVVHFIDFLTTNTQRSDFDGDGDNDGVDNAEAFVIFVQGQSSQGCDGPNNVGGVAGGYCP